MPYRLFIAQRQYLIVILALIGLSMLLLQWRLGQPQSRVTLDALAYYSDRNGRPVWQVVTAHFVHLDWPHLWANLTALIATCVIFWPIFNTTRLLVLLLFGACGAAAAASLLADAHSFVGFSALTHALVSYATVAVLTNTKAQRTQTDSRLDIRPAVGWFMLLAIVAKSAVELWPTTTALNWLQQSVAAEAHLGGLLSGALVGLGVFYRRIKTPSKPPG